MDQTDQTDQSPDQAATPNEPHTSVTGAYSLLRLFEVHTIVSEIVFTTSTEFDLTPQLFREKYCHIGPSWGLRRQAQVQTDVISARYE